MPTRRSACGEANVADQMGLIRNCLFLGTHLEQTVQLGDFTFTMAIGGPLKEDAALFVETMEPVLPAAVGIFGGMPAESHYLVVLNSSDRSDGGAFTSSYSMLIRGDVNQASSVIWGHGISHELIHFWNGHTLKPTSYREEWFKEGFTDYLTILVRSRSGLEPREQIYRKLENSMRRYLLSKMILGVEESMREAGKEKHRYRMYVYGGGTLVAFALDVRIRQATGNAKGLDDLMATMCEQYAYQGKAYELADIVRVASEVSGEDQSSFFERYVDGMELLDPAPYVEAVGLQLDTFVDEFYVSERVGATAEQRAIGEALFGALRGQLLRTNPHDSNESP